MDDYTIESNVPVPAVRRSKNAKYPFDKMKVGESFFVTISPSEWVRGMTRVDVAIHRYKTAHPETQWTRSARRGTAGIRVWRAA